MKIEVDVSFTVPVADAAASSDVAAADDNRAKQRTE
jgi:hypothetical protein